jgi:hypothetical protein
MKYLMEDSKKAKSSMFVRSIESKSPIIGYDIFSYRKYLYAEVLVLAIDVRAVIDFSERTYFKDDVVITECKVVGDQIRITLICPFTSVLFDKDIHEYSHPPLFL